MMTIDDQAANIEVLDVNDDSTEVGLSGQGVPALPEQAGQQASVGVGRRGLKRKRPEEDGDLPPAKKRKLEKNQPVVPRVVLRARRRL